MKPERFLVFISSTYEDLVEEREKVIRTVLEQNCFPASMEFFPAVGLPPIDLIQRVIKDCDYFILIIGNRYGSLYKDGMGFTEKEYSIAVENGVPVLAFVRSSDDSNPDEETKQLARFKERVEKGGHYVRKWSNADELARLVSSSIATIKDIQPRRGWVRGDQACIPPQRIEVRRREKSYIIKIDDIAFKMVHVEGGSFMMGATSEQEKYAGKNEKPAHPVTVDDFWIGETQVTQALWAKIMGSNPSYFTISNGYQDDDLNRPVEQVSWNDCQRFITTLNSLATDKLKGAVEFDFPSEEQWEYAARGGNKSQGFIYAGADTICNVARYDHNMDGKTWPVGRSGLIPNELGLYDMSGNVWEWTKTVYTERKTKRTRKTDSGEKYVGRGGCWHSEKNCCRVSYRTSANATHSGNGLGLRLVLNKTEK